RRRSLQRPRPSRGPIDSRDRTRTRSARRSARARSEQRRRRPPSSSRRACRSGSRTARPAAPPWSTRRRTVGCDRSLRAVARATSRRSEEHTSELQSPYDLVCRLLLEKKKKKIIKYNVVAINNITYRNEEINTSMI